MEFRLLVGDMSFFVFCKFEIVIFKIVQVMTENIPFAFLYVLSIYDYKMALQCFIFFFAEDAHNKRSRRSKQLMDIGISVFHHSAVVLRSVSITSDEKS